jgi:GntR family transcriptional regulator/MocR family aminotransferase
MPRAPSGVLLPPLPLTRVRRVDLYRLLRDRILDGTLPPGVRLPSTRELALEHQVSRTTVEEVYQQLESEGFVVRVRGSGSFVAHDLPRAPAARADRASPLALSARGRALAESARCREPAVHRAFDAGVPDLSTFPVAQWSQCTQRALRDLARGDLNHSDPRGWQPLREALARHLAQFRGVRATPDRVVVFGSSLSALHAIALLLLDPGDAVWLEDPGYLGARAAFELNQVRVVPVPVDAQGLRVSEGLARAPHAKLAYLTPAHQYPSGVVLTPERRTQLIAWARETRACLIEDDYDGEFRLGGQPLTALHALDDAQVIYLGTMAKATFMGLRLAYAVLPEPLVEPMANLRTQLDGFPPIVSQATLARFIDEGHLATHIRRVRGAYADKRAALVEGLAPLAAAGWTLGENAVGMHACLFEPRAGAARAVVARSGLALNALSDYAIEALARDGLYLRFGGLTPEAIRAGCVQLRRDCSM